MIGPNGAGKTSFVHALTGSIPATSGAVLIAGEDVTRKSQAARVHKGLARSPDRPDQPGSPCWSRVSPAPMGLSGSMTSSRGSRSGGATWATGFRAANSRCWRSGAR
ncbi:MAG: ATP-binding cassette domain-containing protein [Pseudodonghicola sp.]